MDGSRLVFMDSITVFWNFTVQSEISSPIIYTSQNGIVLLSIASRFDCAPDYFGFDCSENCAVEDDEYYQYACSSSSSSSTSAGGDPGSPSNCPKSSTLR